MGCGKLEFVEQLKSRAAVAEAVVYADLCYLNRTFLACNSAYCVAKTADNIMLLNGDDSACFLCGFDDDFSVDRLNCVNVDEAGVDTLLPKLSASLESLVYAKTCCDNRYIVAVK